ncbi:GDSL-like Lipase/Acylhydrolase family protein [Striga asiatica]|uniref:GDSL-like Lipase/Acylhydrolase family protein n=1 Tax=Striga asiatica TaxID=4170 RepID=A0A5A7Q5J6_STRAF|nr:GDSL-like Lipase/Acylhydrolase family protein [Striga asiatica]
MRRQNVKVDNDVMKKVFGFNLVGKRSKPADFNAKKTWTELSLHTSWDSRGMLNGLIQDLGTAVVHRFIGYNITGKKEANKTLCMRLHLTDLIQNRTTPREYTKRKAYDTYFNKLEGIGA